MVRVVGLEVVAKSSTPVSGNAAEFFDNAPTFFSTIMASVVGLEAVDKKSTTVGGDMPDFLKMSRNTFRP